MPAQFPPSSGTRGEQLAVLGCVQTAAVDRVPQHQPQGKAKVAGAGERGCLHARFVIGISSSADLRLSCDPS